MGCPLRRRSGAALTRASAATLDRLLRPLRRRRPPPAAAASPRPSPPLRAQVPLRTWSEWTGVGPGGAARRSGPTLRRVDGRPAIARPWSPSTWPRVGPSSRPSGICTTSGSPAPIQHVHARPCRFRCARGTATMAVSSSTPPCSAGAGATGFASPAGGPPARTTRPGSSSATACSCAGSSATTASAPGLAGPSCNASTTCSDSSTTSSARCGSCAATTADRQ